MSQYKLKLTVAFLLLLAGIRSFAQSGDKNYLQTLTPNKAITTDAKLNLLANNKDSVKNNIAYYDGLGRPWQTVQRQASPSAKDIVQPFTYDQFGRG